MDFQHQAVLYKSAHQSISDNTDKCPETDHRQQQIKWLSLISECIHLPVNESLKEAVSPPT